MKVNGIWRIKPAQTATRRAAYLDGVDYIARNDGVLETDQALVKGRPSVALLASLFGMDPENVAFDVLRVRAYIAKEEKSAQ